MSILLQNLTKRYGKQSVVNHVSLEIAEGELFVLLGASGSGKSTILRMIAGLTTCDEGRIFLKGRDVTDLAPQPRGTGLVFQNYSIFRHMTVGQNIEFGLRIRKVPHGDRARRREELLELVGLAGYGDRYAHQISGGQQQRVALARALAYEPAVLLLDEPLGALDVKIRAQLRRSLKEIQRRLGVTTLLVTHDQEEAYELADRIGVMDRGTLLEVGPPEKLYAAPRTLYAASFLGGGTVLGGRVRDGKGWFGAVHLPIPKEVPHEDGASVELLFRPEQVQLSVAEPGASAAVVLGKGSIIEQLFSGATRRLRLRLPRLPGTRQVSPPLPFGETAFVIDAILPAGAAIDKTELWVSLQSWTILEQAPPRLLVIDTGSGSRAALELAQAMAARIPASVSVLIFSADEPSAKLREAVETRAREAGLRAFEVNGSSGTLGQQIAAQCANTLFEMIFLPAHLKSSKSGVDPEVVSFVHNTVIPVIVAAGRMEKNISRILICTRAGEPGKSDIRIGGRLARHLGAQVTLLHITRPGAEILPRVRRHLEQASATLTSLEVINEVLTRGEPAAAEAIVREAANHDLTVIGGHGPAGKSIFGRDDITLQVLAHAQRPVLVVPAEE